ncbi:hypothetical protein Tco_0706538 [Tanacetum coccineum]|uniref:Uncharacterized protein n=1 Tax=Tanacetum coccineum TaxID=301880 RepID=A0ABQ4Y8M2_9ASTR
MPQAVEICDFGGYPTPVQTSLRKSVSVLTRILLILLETFNMHYVGTTLVTGRGTALFTSKSCAQIRTRRLSMVLQLQGFRVKRKLSYGEQYLHVGNGAQAAVEAIGVFNLVLPSGLVLSLNNCHYAPSIVRGVVSFSCLLDLGFVHTITSNGVSGSLNEVELQLGKKIKALRSDKGGEYFKAQEFKDLSRCNGNWEMNSMNVVNEVGLEVGLFQAKVLRSQVVVFAQNLVSPISTESREASTGLLNLLLCDAFWQCEKDDYEVSGRVMSLCHRGNSRPGRARSKQRLLMSATQANIHGCFDAAIGGCLD